MPIYANSSLLDSGVGNHSSFTVLYTDYIISCNVIYCPYRIYIVLFILLLGPLIFFDLSKSKWLQLFTAVLRNISLLLMILIAGIHIAMGNISSPRVVNFSFAPNLFGVIIYAFMCQHSIPGMITPLNTKSKVNLLLFVDYLSILCYYATLSFTAVFRLVSHFCDRIFYTFNNFSYNYLYIFIYSIMWIPYKLYNLF